MSVALILKLFYLVSFKTVVAQMLQPEMFPFERSEHHIFTAAVDTQHS